MATLPTVQNAAALENLLLDALRERAVTEGFAYFSTLIEEHLLATGPSWLKAAVVLEQVDNYLRSGITFVYLQVPLTAPSGVSEAAP